VRSGGQGYLQSSGSEVYAGTGDSLSLEPHKHVCPQSVIHVVPGRLDQCLVLFTFQDLKVHDDNLVGMLDMHTEAQLLQDPPFRFDDLVFGVNVVLIKYQ